MVWCAFQKPFVAFDEVAGNYLWTATLYACQKTMAHWLSGCKHTAMTHGLLSKQHVNFYETKNIRQYQSTKFGWLVTKPILNSSGVSVVDFANAAAMIVFFKIFLEFGNQRDHS